MELHPSPALRGAPRRCWKSASGAVPRKSAVVKPPKAENPFRVSTAASSSLHSGAEMGSRGTGRSINTLEGREEGKRAEGSGRAKRAGASQDRRGEDRERKKWFPSEKKPSAKKPPSPLSGLELGWCTPIIKRLRLRP